MKRWITAFLAAACLMTAPVLPVSAEETTTTAVSTETTTTTTTAVSPSPITVHSVNTGDKGIGVALAALLCAATAGVWSLGKRKDDS